MVRVQLAAPCAEPRSSQCNLGLGQPGAVSDTADPVFVLQRTGEELSVYIHARVLTPLLPYRKYYGKYATDPRDVPQKIRKLNTYLF